MKEPSHTQTNPLLTNLSKPKRAQNQQHSANTHRHKHCVQAREGIYTDRRQDEATKGIQGVEATEATEAHISDFLAQLERRRMSVKIASGM